MDKKILEQLAELSKLSFSNAEYGVLSKRFDEKLEEVSPILAFAGKPMPPNNVSTLDSLRPDEVKPSLSLEELAKNAPRFRDRYFVVPLTLE